MSGLAESLIFAGLMAGADMGSTAYARSRGGVEVGVIKSDPVRVGVATVVIGLGDYGVQRMDKRMKWPYRVLVAGVYGWIVVHNVKVGRELR